jgi:exopolysaccharide biosynthesis polyprenyl glycosylphosphotransferase
VLAQSRNARARLLQVCDGSLFALSLSLAYLLRATFPFFDLPQIEAFVEHLWLFPVIAIISPVTLEKLGFYQYPQITSRLNVIWIVMRGSVVVMMALISVLFLVRVQYARSVILLACLFGAVFVYFRHEVFMRLVTLPLSRNQWRQRVLWVGQTDDNARLRAALSAEERAQLESITEFDPRTDPLENLVPILHDFAINIVVINLTGLENAQIQPVLGACEREGVSIVLRPGILARSPLGMSIDWFAGEPVIHYRAQKARPSHLVIKQVADYAGAAFFLLLLSPVFVGIILAIRLTSPGPVFYRQTRSGLNGRPFQLLKFRSMRVGADREKASLAPLNEMTGPVFKLTRDPRVTRVGRILRRHSLDELPQLLNVLRGEMSLVGPRPLPVEEVKQFSDDAFRRRLSVKPGLTCLWQVGGRNDISDFEEWVRLDLSYIDRWSLWLDLKILLATIPVVLFGKGGR